MEIEKNLVVSSAHITAEDMELIQRWATESRPPLIVYDQLYWVMVLLSREEGIDLSAFSPQFRELYAWAAASDENFTFLKFDGDAPLLEGFPTP